MNALICGTREKWLSESEAFDARLISHSAVEGLMLRASATGERLVVIHGGATGVDTWVDNACKFFGVECVVVKPDYDKYGRRAPVVRDEEMVLMADLVFAVWNGRSGGTKHTIDFALKHGRELAVSFIRATDAAQTAE